MPSLLYQYLTAVDAESRTFLRFEFGRKNLGLESVTPINFVLTLEKKKK